jgi:ribonuclease HII
LKIKKTYSKVDWRTFGFLLVAGLDEAGRGCLAGPVYAAAVILPPDFELQGLTDSKLLTSEKRYELALQIKLGATAWAVGTASVEEIEKINILQASLLSMRRAVEALKLTPELLLIDGNQRVGGVWRQETLIKGDLRCMPISAASILAKTERDLFMSELHEQFPHYGLDLHKGYPTPIHKQAIIKHGPAPIHRRTFSGVREFVSEVRLANL